MEQEPKNRPVRSLMGAAAGTVAVCLLMGLCRWGGAAVQTWGSSELVWPRQEPAAVETLAVGDRVVPMGSTVGIKLFSDGVLVVGLSPVETASGTCEPGKECGLKAGDVITHIDGSEVDTIEEVQAVLARREGEPLTIQAVRGERQLQLTAAPAENEQGVYQLGVWLRDSMAGIGTVTFWDPASGAFGALGHGINDVDTAMLMPLETGSIMKASVSEVRKGTSGQPGELRGEFDLTADLGTLYANTQAGVFGRGTGWKNEGETVPVAGWREVKRGPATILSTVRGDGVESFEVEITHVASDREGVKNLMLEVTDPRLLERTGGIVQGMSGSPIIQNGKLVGAVTHVLVNDPTRGYGIFIENMLDAAG